MLLRTLSDGVTLARATAIDIESKSNLPISHWPTQTHADIYIYTHRPGVAAKNSTMVVHFINSSSNRNRKQIRSTGGCSSCLVGPWRGFVWDLRFRFGVWGLGFGVWGLGFGVRLNSLLLLRCTWLAAAAWWCGRVCGSRRPLGEVRAVYGTGSSFKHTQKENYGVLELYFCIVFFFLDGQV